MSEAADALLECEHRETAVRLRTLSNGSTCVQQQCRTCGESVGLFIEKRAVEVEKLEPWDEELSHRTEEARRLRSEAWQLERERWLREREQENERWHREYDEYRLTPEWRARRKLVWARAQGVCEGCRRAEAAEVHHLTYRHVGDEFLFQLVALCAACHRRFHGHENGEGGAP